MNYYEFYKKSNESAIDFWKEQSQNIAWFSNPSAILSNDSNDYPLWYADGELNACYLAIDKHIEDGFGEQVAIILATSFHTSNVNMLRLMVDGN